MHVYISNPCLTQYFIILDFELLLTLQAETRVKNTCSVRRIGRFSKELLSLYLRCVLRSHCVGVCAEALGNLPQTL